MNSGKSFVAGQTVEYIGKKHNIYPDFYPEVGTLGTVVCAGVSRSLVVQWEAGSTSLNDKWSVMCDELRVVDDHDHFDDISNERIDFVPEDILI